MPENVPLVAQILVNHSNQSSQRAGGGGQRATPTSTGGETPDGKKQSKVLQSISGYARKQSESAKESAKTGKFSLAKAIGMNFTLGSILKQSQIFASVAGSIFQIMGALIDVILAPFVPLIVPWIRKLAEAVPAAAEKAREFQQWLVNTAWPYVVSIWKRLPEWLREGVSKPLKYIIGTYLVLKFTGLLNIVTGLLFMGFGTANKTLAAILWVAGAQLKIAKVGAIWGKAAGAGSMGAILAGISLSLVTFLAVIVGIGVVLALLWKWLGKETAEGNMGMRTRMTPSPFQTDPNTASPLADGIGAIWGAISNALLKYGPDTTWQASVGNTISGWIESAMRGLFQNPFSDNKTDNRNLGEGNAVLTSLITSTTTGSGDGVNEYFSNNVRPGGSQVTVTVNNNTDDTIIVNGSKQVETPMKPSGGGHYYFDHIRNQWVAFDSGLGTGSVSYL